MRKTIFIMFGFIAFYLGGMFFVEKHFGYDWTPAKKIQTAPEPAPQEDLVAQAVPETIIEQGILPDILPEEEKPKIEEPVIIKPKPIPLKQRLAEKDLVDIETLPVKVFLDMRYATTNNFTGKQLYNRAKCYLKRPVAQALLKAAKYAREADEPFYFCIYDCYRPKSVQKIMLESTDKQGYLAQVSNHNRGMAVDLGPCDAQGEALLTPTEFDTFSVLSGAYNNDEDIPQIAIKNRTALQNVMKRAGFKTISNEWWHFDYPGAKNEEVLNIKF